MKRTTELYDELMASDWAAMRKPIRPLGCHLEYSDEIADFSKVRSQYTDRLIEPYDAFATHGRDVYSDIIKLTSPLAGSLVLLDLGCGSGQFLEALVDIGHQPEDLCGCTIHVGEARAGQKAGLEVAPVDMREIDQYYTPGCFNCITALWSFNHIGLEERVEVMDKAFDLLAPGGMFIGRAYHRDPGNTAIPPPSRHKVSGITFPSKFGVISCYRRL